MKFVAFAAALAAAAGIAYPAFAAGATPGPSSAELAKAAAEQMKDPDRVGTRMKVSHPPNSADLTVISSIDRQRLKSREMRIVSSSGH